MKGFNQGSDVICVVKGPPVAALDLQVRIKVRGWK